MRIYVGGPADRSRTEEVFREPNATRPTQAISDQIICGLQGPGRTVGGTMRGHEPRSSPVLVCLRDRRVAAAPTALGQPRTGHSSGTENPTRWQKIIMGFGL
jgi:hypothetical protein